MKQLKMFLMLLLVSLFFIPSTYAYEIDGASFSVPIGYWKNKNDIIYNVTNNVNSLRYNNANEKVTYLTRIQAVDNMSISSSQLLLYVNVCYSQPTQLQFLTSIENVTGTLKDLDQIANNMGELGSCSFGSNEGRGYLYTGVWSMSYALQRNSEGNSFLNSFITFNSKSALGYATTFKFNNIYISKYDESVIQNLKQQQISEKTNTYLQQQINEQQQTNNKLDQTNDKLDSILDNSNPDLGGLTNSSTWLPQGPVDSIIMLPLNFINTIIDKLSGTCSPVNLPIPFMQNKYIVLPCLNTIFENIEGFSTLFNLVGVIGSVYLLYNYFIRFYKWVDDTLSFRENTWQDWGGD